MASITSCQNRKAADRRGLTLMELLISLVLTGVTLVLISTAMDLHLRALEKRRGRAEEGQGARARGQQIGKDLRNAVQFSTIDMEEGLGGLDSGALMDLAGSAIASGDIDMGDVNMGAVLGGMFGAGSDPEEPTSSYTPDLVSNLEPPVYHQNDQQHDPPPGRIAVSRIAS